MSAAKDDDFDLPAADHALSTGAAADSAHSDDRLKGLPRVLRYSMLIIYRADHVLERLAAEIDELCPQLPQNVAWATARTPDAALVLAAELDRRAVIQNEPNLRGLADCVRLVYLPTPRDAVYFEE